MLIRLRVRQRIDGPIEDREFSLEALRVGRAPSADLVIPDDAAQTVSWQHARVDTTADGILLHDLKSTNGTFLNGRRIDGPERIRPGDRIQLGQKGPMLEVVALQAHNGVAPHQSQFDPTYVQPPTPAPMRSAPLPPVHRGSSPQSRQPAQISATRALLVGMQKKQRFWMFGAGGTLLAAGLVIAIMLWRHESRIDSLEEEVAKINARFLDEETDADSVDSSKDSIDQATRDQYNRTHDLDDKVKSGRASGEVIYQRTVLSTAWVISDQQEGTGSVIEHDGKRLIVTSYHVINGARKVGVIFPKFLNGKVLANHGQYLRDGPVGGSDSIPCSVWASDPGVDIAILEPASLPEAIRPLTIADASVGPGADVHTVGGNPSGTNALWSYTRGSVRQVAGPVEMDFRSGQKVLATIVETQNPINHGDSGGPLVNKRCELVGVTAGAAESANLVSRFIDIGHVKEVLRTRPQKTLTRYEPPVPPPVKPPPGPKTPPKNPVVPPKSPPVKPPDKIAAGNGHIYVLMLIDDVDDRRPNGEKGIGEGVRVNEKSMRSLLENGLPQGRTTIETLKGKQCNRNSIREYYQRLHPRPEDTIVCYYAGHGCTDKTTGAHYFAMNGGGNMGPNYPALLVPRGEVRQLMKSSGGRLWVLISDCCSSWAELSRTSPRNTTEFARGSYLVPLLLKQHGAVDLQAASPGEFGFSVWDKSGRPLGGPFTKYLCQTCEAGNFVDWDQVYQETRNKTVADSKQWVPSNKEAAKNGQTQQTPFRFADMHAMRD
jgi:S1-C subfamily serine protease